MPKDFENFAKVANVFTKSGHTDCLPMRVLKRERERERERSRIIPRMALSFAGVEAIRGDENSAKI